MDEHLRKEKRMYIGFNLQLNEDAGIFSDKVDYEMFKEKGEMHLTNQTKNLGKDLETYVKDDEIDGTKIQNERFPLIEADVFISHSGKDDELANALAGWLNETFKLKCFIDKNVWGYSKTLLEQMNSSLSDKRKNGNSGYLYNHESCNQVAQHVNMMLSVALQKMIDRSETVIFLNTENAIKIHGEDCMEKTYSPWIYSEIISTQLIRKKPLLEYRKSNLSFDVNESALILEHSDIAYNVSLNHLMSLSEDDLQRWSKRQKIRKYKYGLDALYDFKCPEDLEKLRRYEII